MSGTIDDEQLVQAYVRDRSVRCPSCDYDLRDLTGSACPECGQGLSLRVALARPNWAAFICGLIGLSMSLGFSSLLLLFAAVIMVVEGPASAMPGTFPALFVGLIVSGALLAVWLARSRTLRRQSGGRRWFLAGCCCSVPILNVVAFLVIVL